MADLKTDYVNDELDTDVNNERTYNLVDANGNLIYEGIKIRETTVLATTGDNYGALQINEQNTKINQINNDLDDKADKTKIVGMPDFSNVIGTDIPNNTVVSANGWLIGSIGITNGIGQILVNDVTVSEGNGAVRFSVQIPVKIGDAVTFSGAGAVSHLSIVGVLN